MKRFVIVTEHTSVFKPRLETFWLHLLYTKVTPKTEASLQYQLIIHTSAFMSRFLILLLICLFLVGCKPIGLAPSHNVTLTVEIPKQEAPKQPAVAAGELPDLAVISFSWSNITGLTQHRLILSSAMANKGKGALKGFEYSFVLYFENQLIMEENRTYKSEFFKGKQAYGAISFIPNLSGTYSGKIILDPKNLIKESNETNNAEIVKINVRYYNASYQNLTALFGNETCVDTDKGRRNNSKNYNLSGSCMDKFSFIESLSDYCRDDETLDEVYCSGGHCKFILYTCPHVCKAGRCY